RTVTPGTCGGVYRGTRPGNSGFGSDVSKLAHSGDPRDIARVHVQRGRFRIDRCPAPLAAAIEPGQDDAAFTTGRREECLAHAPKTLVLLRDVRRVDRLARERSRPDGKRLGWRRALPTQVRSRHRAFDDLEHWLARPPVEQKHEAALRDLRCRIDARTAACDRYEIRRRRKIAVPEIVVHRLEMPQPFPGGGIEGNERVREQIRANARPAVEIG